MTRTAPRAISLKNHMKKIAPMRAVRITDGAGKTQRSYDKILTMVFTSDGVGVVIRGVELFDLEKTVF